MPTSSTPISNISGAFELQSEAFHDHRGTFLNAFRSAESEFLRSWSGSRSIAQVNICRTISAGVIRGLHYQPLTYGDAKLIRCIRGMVWDVVADVRPTSPTYKNWYALELTPDNGKALIIPEGCAHGYQSIAPNSEVLYLHSGDWYPEFETGVRYDDESLSVKWPLPVADLSEKDKNLPFLTDKKL